MSSEDWPLAMEHADRAAAVICAVLAVLGWGAWLTGLLCDCPVI